MANLLFTPVAKEKPNGLFLTYTPHHFNQIFLEKSDMKICYVNLKRNFIYFHVDMPQISNIGFGACTNHVDKRGGGGLVQMTTTLNNSY